VNKKVWSLLLVLSLTLFAGCQREVSVVETIEEATEESVSETSEILITPTLTPTPVPAVTLTPTPVPEDFDRRITVTHPLSMYEYEYFEGEFPSYAAQEGITDASDLGSVHATGNLASDYETLLVNDLETVFGVLPDFTQFDMHANENNPILIETEISLNGIIYTNIADYDGDYANEMIVVGFTDSTTSNGTCVFVLLCDRVGSEVLPVDILFYEPMDPECYGYGNGILPSNGSSNMTLCVWNTYINGRRCVALGFVKNGNTCDSNWVNVGYFDANESSIRLRRMIYQTGGGSDGFQYTVLDFVNNSVESAVNESSYTFESPIVTVSCFIAFEDGEYYYRILKE